MHDFEHSSGWKAANRALWLVGTAVVAAHGVALLRYGSGARAAVEEASQQQIISEHNQLCDELGVVAQKADRERCLNLLLQLQQQHEQSFMARTSGWF
jgi:hypothetical protein